MISFETQKYQEYILHADLVTESTFQMIIRQLASSHVCQPVYTHTNAGRSIEWDNVRTGRNFAAKPCEQMSIVGKI